MPDETPSGGSTPPSDPAAQGSDTAPATTPPAENPEAQRASREAARYRTQLREAEKQRDEMRQQLDELKAKSTPSPDGAEASEVAQLKRSLGELQKTVKDAQDRALKAEDASRQEKLDNALLKAISEAGLLDPEDAAIIARTKGRARIADDGKPVFVVTESGEEREVVISATALKQFKLVPERFFPSDGAPGAGSRGGSRGAGAQGIDMQRALRDVNYFAEHQEKILAAKRGAH